MEKAIDSYRYLNGITKRVVKSWIGMEQPRPIPWTPLARPLSECTVALCVAGAAEAGTQQPTRRSPHCAPPGTQPVVAAAAVAPGRPGLTAWRDGRFPSNPPQHRESPPTLLCGRLRFGHRTIGHCLCQNAGLSVS